jgi:hypothetical protein
VRVVTAADGPTTVVIEGDRPLPSPVVGVVTEGRPRIYVDFTGVVTDTTGITAEGDPWIKRVRVAIHSQDPLVTRVVIDLFRATPHTSDASPPSSTQFIVSVGGGATRPSIPAPTVRSAPARSERAPSDAPKPESSRPQSPRADEYVKQAAAAVARFEKLRPVLAAIDKQVDQQGINLQLAVTELDAITRSLNALRVPRQMQETHDQLEQACTLALRAVRTRMEFATTGNAPLELNAASAAAGALMLMDRARVALEAQAQKDGAA